MKISKLFHWLYAFLLLMPIAYVGFRCFYCIFNENATSSVALDTIFENSVNNLNTIPLFAWAQTSFLVEPFTYITDLFGIADTSPINTLLSYWLSISIIWLVFDVVMYVPLLVHRWLDKGIIE